MTKRKNNAGKELVAIYEKITCLDKVYKDMPDADLMALSAEVYNSLVAGLLPKRRVLLNELLDLETELRVRDK